MMLNQVRLQIASSEYDIPPKWCSTGETMLDSPKTPKITRPGKRLHSELERSTIFHGKTMENHHFSWDNYGKSPFFMGQLWKITIFNGKTMENHHFSWAPFLMGQLTISMAIFNSYVSLPEGKHTSMTMIKVINHCH